MNYEHDLRFRSLFGAARLQDVSYMSGFLAGTLGLHLEHLCYIPRHATIAWSTRVLPLTKWLEPLYAMHAS